MRYTPQYAQCVYSMRRSGAQTEHGDDGARRAAEDGKISRIQDFPDRLEGTRRCDRAGGGTMSISTRWDDSARTNLAKNKKKGDTSGTFRLVPLEPSRRSARTPFRRASSARRPESSVQRRESGVNHVPVFGARRRRARLSGGAGTLSMARGWCWAPVGQVVRAVHTKNLLLLITRPIPITSTRGAIKSE